MTLCSGVPATAADGVPRAGTSGCVPTGLDGHADGHQQVSLSLRTSGENRNLLVSTCKSTKSGQEYQCKSQWKIEDCQFIFQDKC